MEPVITTHLFFPSSWNSLRCGYVFIDEFEGSHQCGFPKSDHKRDEMEQRLISLDARRRINLRGIASHDRYLAKVEANGTIVLTPAVVVTQMEDSDKAKKIDEFLANPESGNIREYDYDTEGLGGT